MCRFILFCPPTTFAFHVLRKETLFARPKALRTSTLCVFGALAQAASEAICAAVAEVPVANTVKLHPVGSQAAMDVTHAFVGVEPWSKVMSSFGVLLKFYAIDRGV